jgi:hypothetical protein
MLPRIIANHFERRSPVTYNFSLDSVFHFFGIGIQSDTFRHLCRGLPGVKTIPGVLMEA